VQKNCTATCGFNGQHVGHGLQDFSRDQKQSFFMVCIAVWWSLLKEWDMVYSTYGNSLDKLCHTRSVAYSVELVRLNKHQISGGRA